MSNAIFQVPVPVNEPVFDYAPGTAERAHLKHTLHEQASRQIEIPLVIGGEEIRTGNLGQAVMPHDHSHVLATYHKAGPAEVQRAITWSAGSARARSKRISARRRIIAIRSWLKCRGKAPNSSAAGGRGPGPQRRP